MAVQIDDGHTIDFFLRGVPGLYPDLHGQRRPTLTRERNAAERVAMEKRTTDENLAVLHKLCISKLVKWDATADHTVKGAKKWGEGNKAQGETLPITADSLGILEPRLWDRLSAVVMGFDPGDEPEGATKEQKDELDQMLAAQSQGEITGDALVEASRKNS